MVSFNHWLFGFYSVFFLANFEELSNCEIFIPIMNERPQKIGILKFWRGIKSKNGPGQSPPIPQPSPNKKDPIISFQSIWPLGSDKPCSESKKVFLLNKLKNLHSFSHNGKNNKIDQDSRHENKDKTRIPIFIKL